MHKNNSTHSEPKLHEVLMNDIHTGNFRKNLRKEYHELKEFYINDQRKGQLETMGWLRRGMYTFWWLLKALFLRLTPIRRLLLILSVILLLSYSNVQYQDENFRIGTNWVILAGVILLFIIMLELKDKLLARDELEAGRVVQRALMPDRTPVVQNWSLWLFTKTANDVGGDLVDFQILANNLYGISVADVSGKGLTAALLMAKLQATLRAIAPDCNSLAELGSKINKIFYRDRLRSFFASLVYMEIRPDTGIVHLLNAGHLQPIVIRKTAVEELPKGNPAIGIFPEMAYQESSIHLQQGDIILVYSDGLTDAKNESGEFYGIQRLLQLLPTTAELSAPEIGEKIVQDVNHFVGDARIYDDLSLVILKRLA